MIKWKSRFNQIDLIYFEENGTYLKLNYDQIRDLKKSLINYTHAFCMVSY